MYRIMFVRFSPRKTKVCKHRLTACFPLATCVFFGIVDVFLCLLVDGGGTREQTWVGWNIGSSSRIIFEWAMPLESTKIGRINSSEEKKTDPQQGGASV
ncbi:hypothetical protein BDN72DRAFT_649217 [Pluteus cervinus]|uniref:Uncharacterized protein n=1 Tax=Pluteus cervinus TaxID=181527 RepID=A0ACD3AV29_9AGAR|nr:hypothetical protein BDN72DRAFT_649217 [Pluteus cervinus]